MFYFGVVFIEPVLMFPGLVANGVPAGLEYCGLQNIPVFFNTLRIQFWESLK
uniref:Uncharacterized protein n=1 Tax=Anguilla anguilla TaxID=7936 RepID=A0A0E9T896_ANGAN